jgi:hypothetical protein
VLVCSALVLCLNKLKNRNKEKETNKSNHKYLKYLEKAQNGTQTRRKHKTSFTYNVR